MSARSSSGAEPRPVPATARLLALLTIVTALLWAVPQVASAQSLEPQPTPTQPAAEPEAAPSPTAERVPPERALLPPADPQAAEAFKVLDAHCARCHQGGRLKRPAPAKFGNILRLDEIARDPALVRPGNPDASRLYTYMLRRLMPYDVHQEHTADNEPTPEEIQTVRQWISRLQPTPVCQDRRLVTIEAQAAALQRAAEQAGETAKRLRFVSLAHLYNACASPEAMFGHRQAILRLFNSLSWKPTPVRVEPVDDAKTLLKIDLDDLGWVPAHWDRILRSAVNGPGNLILLPKAATEPFGVDQPVVRGDWLADTVLRAPLYYDLIGMPALSSEIVKILQIDPVAMRRSGEAMREPIKPSAFATASRIAERLGARNRAMWTVFDAPPRDGRRELADLPATPTAPIPAHDAALSLFMLPNGLPAYVIANGRGDRMDQIPADVAKPSIAAKRPIKAGLDCMGCHGLGPSAHTTSTADIARAAERDRETIREALSAVGIEPGFTIDGLEPISALVREFTRPVAELRAATEFGIESGTLEASIAATSGRTQLLLRRLAAGLVGRAEFEGEYRSVLADLRKVALAPDPSAVPPAVEPIDPGPTLTLLADKVAYKTGDTLQLTIKTKTDCYLTLISIDQKGRGTVLYPSDFEPSNLLAADRELQLPASGAPYLFRLKTKGRETIVAVCNTAGASIDGIRHDFERQRFTDLGDYGAFLTQAEAQAGAQAADRRAAQTAPAPVTDAKGRLKRRNPMKPDVPDTRPRPDQLTHTAITIEIR